MDQVFEYMSPFLPKDGGNGKGLKALDVATGTGVFARYLANRSTTNGLCSTVTGLDTTPGMLALARSNAAKEGLDIVFIEGDASDMRTEFPTGSFDLVVSRLAVHHFPDPAVQLAEMARVCRVGGLVVIADLISPYDPEEAKEHNRLENLRDPSHTRALNPMELVGLFSKNGLHIKSSAATTTMEVKIPGTGGIGGHQLVNIPYLENVMLLKEWMDSTKTAQHARSDIESALQNELAGGRISGMRPFYRDGGVEGGGGGEVDNMSFTHRWVVVAGTKQ